MNDAPLLPIAMSLIAGIITGDAAGARVPALAWLCVAAALLVVAMAFNGGRRHGIEGRRQTDDGRRRGRWQSILLLGCVMAMGAALVSHQEVSRTITMPQDAIPWRGVVMSEPQVRGKVVRCDILITEGPWRQPVKVKAAILRDTLTGRWQRLHVGNGIEALSRMEPLRNFRQSNFDYVRWQQVHGYSFNTFIYYRNWQKARVSLRQLPLVDRLRLRMLTVRHQLLARYQLLGLDEQQYAVVAAMTLGEKGALSQALKDDYSMSGGSHVLALSGLHLSVIYALLTFCFMSGRRRRLWVSQTLIVVAIWMYVLLVGLMPSVVRSATMLTLYSLCLVLGRQGVTLSNLACAAIVMLVVNPQTLWDVGFQMSFMAVAAIVVGYPLIDGCCRGTATRLTANSINDFASSLGGNTSSVYGKAKGLIDKAESLIKKNGAAAVALDVGHGGHGGQCTTGHCTAGGLLLRTFLVLFPSDQLHRHPCGDGDPLWCCGNGGGDARDDVATAHRRGIGDGGRMAQRRRGMDCATAWRQHREHPHDATTGVAPLCPHRLRTSGTGYIPARKSSCTAVD